MGCNCSAEAEAEDKLPEMVEQHRVFLMYTVNKSAFAPIVPFACEFAEVTTRPVGQQPLAGANPQYLQPNPGQAGGPFEASPSQVPPPVYGHPAPTSAAPPQYAAPPGVMQQPPGVMQQPPGVMQQPPGVMQQPPGVMQQPPGVMQQPPGVMQQPPGVMQQPPGVMQQPPGVMQQPLPSNNGMGVMAVPTEVDSLLEYYIREYEAVALDKERSKYPHLSREGLFIQHVHRLNPVGYAEDMAMGVRTPGAPFVMNRRYKPMILRQLYTATKMVRLGPTKEARQGLVKKYLMFLHLAPTAIAQRQVIVPTLGIDLVWHSHMSYPKYYTRHCKEIVGQMLTHSDEIPYSDLERDRAATRALWNSTYTEQYDDQCKIQVQSAPGTAAAQQQQTRTAYHGAACTGGCSALVAGAGLLLIASSCGGYGGCGAACGGADCGGGCGGGCGGDGAGCGGGCGGGGCGGGCGGCGGCGGG